MLFGLVLNQSRPLRRSRFLRRSIFLEMPHLFMDDCTLCPARPWPEEEGTAISRGSVRCLVQASGVDGNGCGLSVITGSGGKWLAYFLSVSESWPAGRRGKYSEGRCLSGRISSTAQFHLLLRLHTASENTHSECSSSSSHPLWHGPGSGTRERASVQGHWFPVFTRTPHT